MRIPGGEGGAALLLVLVVVALLTALLGEFAYSTFIDLRLTETFRDRTKAYYLAKGGVAAGRVILMQDGNDYDSPTELWGQGIPGYPVGEGTVSVAIEDLDGRLNVNRLVQENNIDVDFKNRFTRLFAALGLDAPEELTAALIDWLDDDDKTYQDPDSYAAGAESDYYLTLPFPYPAKNGPMDTLEELALVRGFDAQTWRRVLPHVTVYGGAGKISLNTATIEVLQALHETVDPAVAEEIVAGRELRPYRKVEDLKELAGYHVAWYAPLKDLVEVKSDTFRILAAGQVNEAVRSVEAVVGNKGRELLYWKVN